MHSRSNQTHADIEVVSDIPFGTGAIGYGTPRPSTRPLLLDMYRPAGKKTSDLRPAVILSHGGAYHRGSKTEDLFEQDGVFNTPIPEYCRRLAARGFVCFSVGYRLTQELPAPSQQPIKRRRDTVARGRIDYVRELLGLPLASNEELLRGVEAAVCDVAAAYAFVREHAGSWGIDPHRMALGGFSAGAFASIYACYAMKVPAAAVVSLSGGMDPEDAAHYLQPGEQQAPVLMFSSEHDLPGIPARTMNLANRADETGLRISRYFVPGKPHFYDRTSPVLLESSSVPGAPENTTLEEALQHFLDVTLMDA